MIGQTIAHFRVTEKIGAGGMGEVYRATDSRLGREVALKIIPEAFASDPQRMARFEREAQLLAALNHPHIATIHGLEVAGGIRALVMELVEGPTLGDRIAQGPMPLEEALPIARQIAEALEFAHERGIIHRDLKPANIKLTQSGEVKLLDFGLAKALEDTPAAEAISNSPTLSAVATRAGVILGTAAYMSPEQAKGKAVDRRADIWSFGVVFYEMLSGKTLYTGETAPETMAHVITKEPTWSDLPPSTPARIRRLLERCLTKDPKKRLRDIGEARIAIEDYQANPAEEVSSGVAAIAPVAAAQPFSRRALPWAVAGVCALAALLGFWRPWSRSAGPPIPMRLEAVIGADVNLQIDWASAALLSPDGTRIAFSALAPAGKRQLYIRSLDQLQASPLSGTDGARDPFFSPDGQWIAFFADAKLKKISSQGGAAVTLCDAPGDRGGAWSEDDTIYFARGNREGLSKVSSGGGASALVTVLDKQEGEITHRWPQVLPGGKAVLFTASNNGATFEDSNLIVQVLATGQRKIVHRGGMYGRYLPSGHLVFVHEGTLFAVPFDLKRLETTGQPAPVVEQVITQPGNGAAQFSFSQTGTLAYLRGASAVRNVSIDWLTADGKLQPLRQTPGDYYNPAFSPDGKRLALEVDDARRGDIWTYDWQRDTLTRLTFSGDSNSNPVWTPDGQRITYSMRDKDGATNIYWKRSDGAGEAQRLTQSKATQYPASWSPDGKFLAFHQNDPGSSTGWDLYTLSMEGNEKTGWKPGEAKPFLNTPATEVYPAFSPDGRWLAYMSNESGAMEVYVRPFPGPGGKWQISSGGGSLPIWSHTSKQLFYRTNDQKIMGVTYSASGESIQASKPVLWSDAPFTNRGTAINYALHSDGKRFAVLKAPGTGADQQVNKFVLVLNFFDELRQKFAAKQ